MLGKMMVEGHYGICTIIRKATDKESFAKIERNGLYLWRRSVNPMRYLSMHTLVSVGRSKVSQYRSKFYTSD